MATFTMSDQNAVPRSVHVGSNFAKGVYTAGGTLTASDIILGVKVPHGAEIVGGYISGHVDNAACVLKVGVSGADTALLSAGTLSATAQLTRFNGGSLPRKISLSDDANPQWQHVFLTVNSGGTDTATASIVLVVEYVMPGAI